MFNKNSCNARNVSSYYKEKQGELINKRENAVRGEKLLGIDS